MTEQDRPRRHRRWLWPLIGLVLAAVAIVLLEGVLSLKHMIGFTSRNAAEVPAEFWHTRHHADLGWVLKGGVSERDRYGPWRTLHTNAAGLRANGEVNSAPPEGVSRIACVGGSAVFGVAVGDDETLCRRLGLADAQFETVNMGQPGYGPGQALLHYEAHPDVPHDIVLFVLDDGSLERLLADRRYGFPKPRLEPGESGLAVRNTPIPRAPYLWPWATVNRDRLAQARLLDALLPKVEIEPVHHSAITGAVLTGNWLTRLEELAEARKVTPIFAYLPGAARDAEAAGKWRRFLADELANREIPFIDLRESFARLDVTNQRGMFRGDGFLTPFGHRWIADALAAELARLEATRAFDGDGPRPWLARYDRGTRLGEPAGTEWLAQLAVDWGTGAPLPGLPAQSFGAVFDACLVLEGPERARVMLEADGSAQLIVNGQTVLDTGEEDGPVQRVNTVALPAGVNQIRVRYRNTGGAAAVRLMLEPERGRARAAGPERFTAPAFSGGEPVCSGDS